MKITSGDFKYRRLTAPVGREARPTSEKVREAVFSMIGENIADAEVLDLFAGTGSLGLEALSRGAKHCTFNDNSAKSLSSLRENIANCKAEDMSAVYRGDYKKCIDRLTGTYDLIFLDPPYKGGYYDDCFSLIAENHLLNEGGLIIAEHDSKMILEEEKESFIKIKEKKYGTVGVSVYKSY